METKSTFDVNSFVELLINKAKTRREQRRLVKYLSISNATNRLIYRAFRNGGATMVYMPNNKITNYSFLLWGVAPTLIETDIDNDQECLSGMHPFMLRPSILSILMQNKRYYEKCFKKNNKPQS